MSDAEEILDSLVSDAQYWNVDYEVLDTTIRLIEILLDKNVKISSTDIGYDGEYSLELLLEGGERGPIMIESYPKSEDFQFMITMTRNILHNDPTTLIMIDFNIWNADEIVDTIFQWINNEEVTTRTLNVVRSYIKN